ncbi:MAG: hypothetical protein Kow0092_23020 [Deferrisomatales bacterium]
MARPVPNRILGLLALGLALLLAGCPPRMSDYEKLIKDGNDYFEMEEFRKAVEAYDRALEMKPGEPGVLVNRGNSKMMLEDAEGALADYAAALELDPKFAEAYANRGILYDRLGRTDEAMADYRKALELKPELGEGPSIWKRILYDTPTETIAQRLGYLEAVRRSGQASPGDAPGKAGASPGGE